MLDFRIETFLTVCETMNFTKAAEQLHITQPAVSHHIRALEEEYAASLFSYQGKRLRLTDAGNTLRETALTMRHDITLLKKQIRSLNSGENSLRFGATLTVGEFTMPPILAAYLKRHPEAQISMQVADTKQLLEQLDAGVIDFAIIEGSFPQAVYDSLLFRKERFISVCGREYAFHQPIRHISDLLRERLLVREQGSGSRHILETYLENRNLMLADFPFQAEVSNIAALKSLTAAGCGVTFLYEVAVRQELQSGVLREIPLKDFSIEHDFSFVWRKNSLFSDRYRGIYQFLKDEMGENGT